LVLRLIIDKGRVLKNFLKGNLDYFWAFGTMIPLGGKKIFHREQQEMVKSQVRPFILNFTT